MNSLSSQVNCYPLFKNTKGKKLDGSFRKNKAALVKFVIPFLIAGGVLVSIIGIQSDVQSFFAKFSTKFSLVFAFLCGAAAVVNPCGFVMLPIYFTHQIDTRDQKQSITLLNRTFKSLVLGVTVSAGFSLVAAVVGIVFSLGGKWLTATIPFFGLIVSMCLLILGGLLLLGKIRLTISSASRVFVKPRRNLINAFLYGIAFSINSLSCILPVFISVIGIGMPNSNISDLLVYFFSYVIGITTVFIIVSVLIAALRATVVKFVTKKFMQLNEFNSFFLIGAGLYLIYYWIFVADTFRMFY